MNSRDAPGVSAELEGGFAAGGVVLRGLTLRVGLGRARRTLIEDASVAFPVGAVSCIVGASGSGKSTLLRAVAGCHRPDGGRIIAAGVAVTELDGSGRRGLRRRVVTTIEQDYNLVETLTARENIMLAIELATGRRNDDGADHWLARLGLWELRDEFPETLSGGERQRVAIARSLAAPHRVVLADEPTGALDEQNGKRVVQLLREFAEAGKCCIVVTHNPSVAAAADCVFTLKEGVLA